MIQGRPSGRRHNTDPMDVLIGQRRNTAPMKPYILVGQRRNTAPTKLPRLSDGQCRNTAPTEVYTSTWRQRNATKVYFFVLFCFCFSFLFLLCFFSFSPSSLLLCFSLVPLYCFGYAKDQGSIRNRMALHQWESTLSRPGGDAHEDFPWRIQLAPAILRCTTLKA